jgi:hypothetical protein
MPLIGDIVIVEPVVAAALGMNDPTKRKRKKAEAKVATTPTFAE